MAPFAFLGSSRDAQLRDLYTGPHLRKLVSKGGPVRLAAGPSIYKNRIIKGLIDQTITPDLLAAIAREHARGRRLLVATANLDAQVMDIWNMGAIAAQGTPQSQDLFRRVLLAAISIPIAFDPIAMRDPDLPDGVLDTHVDASILAGFYASEALFPVEACKSGRTRCSLYVVIHNKLLPEPETVPWSAAGIGRRTLETMMKGNLAAQLKTARLWSRRDAIETRCAYLDVPFKGVSATHFDPAYMQAIYAIGERLGRTGAAWRDADGKPLVPLQPTSRKPGGNSPAQTEAIR